MENKKKRQHYIPQVYLRQFAYLKNKKENKEIYYTNVYNVLEQRYFPSNVEKICAESYFYDIRNKSLLSKSNNLNSFILDEQVLEKTLSKLEGEYNVIFSNAQDNFDWFSTILNNFYTYQLLAIQMLRLPNAKEIYREVYKVHNINLDDSQINIVILQELLNTLNCEYKRNVPIFLEWLLDSYGSVRVCVAPEEIEITSSDNPIIRVSNFKEYGEVIIFPVSTNRCLLFYKKKLKSYAQARREAIEKWDSELTDKERVQATSALEKDINALSFTKKIEINDELSKVLKYQEEIIEKQEMKYVGEEKLSNTDIENINCLIFCSCENIVFSKSKIGDTNLNIYMKTREKVKSKDF